MRDLHVGPTYKEMEEPQEFDDVESLIREGSKEISRRNIDKAITKYAKAYKIASASGLHEAVVSCACNLGAALLSQGQPDSAIEYLEQAARTLESECYQQNEALHGDVMFNLGLAYGMKKDHQAAKRHFTGAAEAFKKSSELRGFADSLQQLGEQYVKLMSPLDAAECFRQAAGGYLTSGHGFLAAKMTVRQVQNLQDAGKPADRSLEVLLNLENLYSQITNSNTDSGKLAKLLCDTGSLLFKLQSANNASTWLHRALDVVRTSQSSSNGKLEAKILLTLGEVCRALGEYTKAVAVYKDASILYGKLDDKKARGQCFYQLAEAYRHLGDHHNAEKYYHIAYQTLEDAGLRSFLWKVLEGLADLNYQRRRLDTSISYYKETLTHLGHRGTHHSIQHQIVSKLATALEVQRVGIVKAASYKKRIPILIQPEQELQLEEPSPVKNDVADNSWTESPVYAPLTSSRLELYSSVDQTKSMLRVPERPKRKSRRRGHRRSGDFDKPVSIGVAEYDSETDTSLYVAKRTASRRKNKTKDVRKNGELSRQKGERPSGPKRLLSHIKGLEIEDDGHPTGESVDNSTQAGPPMSPKHSTLHGFNTTYFSDSDSAMRRGRSVSQTVLSDEGSASSSAKSDENSLTSVTSEEDSGTGISSSEEKSEDSDSSEEDSKLLEKSSRSHQDNTYEQPSAIEPLYATIKSRKLSPSHSEENLYESLNDAKSTADLASTIPKRAAPSLPGPPPEPPLGPRRSLVTQLHRFETDEPTTSWRDYMYPESAALRNMPRGQREMGLYQVARLAQERQAAESARSSMSSVTSDAKVPKSRVCIVM